MTSKGQIVADRTNVRAVYHVISYILRCITLNVKFKCHHLVAMGLQLTLYHIVPSSRHLARETYAHLNGIGLRTADKSTHLQVNFHTCI